MREGELYVADVGVREGGQRQATQVACKRFTREPRNIPFSKHGGDHAAQQQLGSSTPPPPTDPFASMLSLWISLELRQG